MYTKRVTIIGKGGDGDKELIKLLSQNYLLKYVIADEFGNLLFNGSPVRNSFFDAHADVVLLAPSLDTETGRVRDMLHHKVPVAESTPYKGIFSTAGSKVLWKKYIPKDLVMSPKVHYVVGSAGNIEHSMELFRQVQLPVRVHTHGNEGKLARSFDDFHSALDESMKNEGHAYVEDVVSGDVVYVVTVPDFRNEPLYVLPTMMKSGNEYVKAKHISDEEHTNLKKIVTKLQRDLGLSHTTQFDFVISKKGLYLKDIHANPERHDSSVFVHAMKYVGSSMADFWRHVVERARDEFSKRK